MKLHVWVGGLLSLFSAALQAVPIDVAQYEFSRSWGGGKAVGNPVEVSRTADGWEIVIPELGRTDELHFPHSGKKIVPPKQIVLHAQALKGKALVKLCLLDKSARKIQTPAQWITPETKRIVFDTSKIKSQFCRLTGIFIEPEIPGTKLLLKRILAVRERPEKEALQISLTFADQKTGAFRKETLKGLRLNLINGSSKTLAGPQKVTFRDLYNRTFTVTVPQTLAPYAAIQVPMPEPPCYGTWYSDIKAEGKAAKFAWLPYNGLKKPANPEFEFAIDNHWIDPAGIEAMDYLGIRAIRSIVSWERIQPNSEKDQMYWKYDARIDPLTKAGIKMREVLVFTPRWAVIDNPKKEYFPRNRMPKNMTIWKNYVRNVLQRYGDRMELLEMWNEPDLSGFFAFPVQDYIRLAKATKEVFNEVKPKVTKYASGGFATMRPSMPYASKFHIAAMKELKDVFELHSYHEHGYFDHYQLMVDGYFLPMRKRLGIRIPWYASETAMHSAKGLDKEQADCLFKKVLFTWARGGISYTWYGLFNNGYDLNYSEDMFGTLDLYQEPKHCFSTYGALIALYGDAKFGKQIKAERNPWLFSFKAPGKMILSSWSNNMNEGAMIYAVKAPGIRSAENVDLNGNRSVLPCQDSIALYCVEPIGSSLVLNQAKKIDAVTPAVRLEVPSAILPDTASVLKLQLANPWNKPIELKTIDSKLKGLTVKGLPAEIKLKPNERKSIPFTVIMKNGTGIINWKLAFSVAGIKENLYVSGKLQPAKKCPNADFSRKPDFYLTDYSQVEGNFEFAPDGIGTMWGGFDDLTATAWLGRAGDKLRLQVIVRDKDRHPSPNPKMLWEGDSVQFHLGFPGQQGFFELGGGLDAAGKAQKACFIAPFGMKTQDIEKQLSLQMYPGNPCTVYQFSIPLKALKVTPETLAKGFHFNLLANDNDSGKGRKFYIRLAPGIGSGQTIDQAPLVVCP